MGNQRACEHRRRHRCRRTGRNGKSRKVQELMPGGFAQALVSADGLPAGACGGRGEIYGISIRVYRLQVGSEATIRTKKAMELGLKVAVKSWPVTERFVSAGLRSPHETS